MREKSPTRKRDAEATADSILSAARQVFHERGYDGATTRDIAERAGVNMALIKRYFGSKLGLFERAVLPYLSLEPVLRAPVETLAETLADTYVNANANANANAKTGFDPFVVLLRSISSAEAGPLLVDALRRQALEPLASALEGDDKDARATLIATQLAGLILQFRILQMPPRTKTEHEAIRARLADYLDGLIAGK